MTQPLIAPTATWRWQQWAPALLAVVAILLLFHATAAEMVDIWSRSVTYNHAFLVPPITLWLIWRQRHKLQGLPVRPQPWVLLPMAAACVLWLLGELAAVNAATQFALVTLIMLAVPALFGMVVARALTFPLLFLYFAVPFGNFLVPIMMEATADFTVLAVQWSGVPVYREGLQFVIPTGSWSVVEACSGIRYLIASFMVGTLFAYLNYRSFKRRALFMVMSLVVPVVANWLRAYMIVMLGHLSGNQLAVGVDHLIYGWVFFGIVIGLMFMIGSRWTEPDAQGIEEAAHAAASRAAAPAEPAARAWLTAAGVAVLMLGTHAALWTIDRPSTQALSPLELPGTLAPGWQVAPQPLSTWLPAFKGFRASQSRSYTGPQGEAAVWIGYYRDQGREAKLVTTTNVLVPLEDTAWSQVQAGTSQVTVAGVPLVVRSAELRGSGHAGVDASQRLLVWHVYWVGGQLTASDARAKLWLAVNRLQGKGDDAAVLIFYTPLDKGAEGPTQAQAVLRQLVSEAMPGLQRTLQGMSGRPARAD